MKSFHHGGRLGDCLYAMYTMKELGGGSIWLSNFQQGNWGADYMEALRPLLRYQEYVDDVYLIQGSQEWIKEFAKEKIEFDLHEAETDYNPEAFPEWHGVSWPGNCHIAKRYAVHFGVAWNPEAVWLTAPKTRKEVVAFHAPMRRCVRPPEYFAAILNTIIDAGVSVVILGGPHDIDEWKPYVSRANYQAPDSLLDYADYINSASVFLGAASSGNVVAEALKKYRLVELADGCDNTYPYGKSGQRINDYSITRTVNKIYQYIQQAP